MLYILYRAHLYRCHTKIKSSQSVFVACTKLRLVTVQYFK